MTNLRRHLIRQAYETLLLTLETFTESTIDREPTSEELAEVRKLLRLATKQTNEL